MLNDGTMIRVSVIDEWKPSDLGVPGLDSHLPGFTDSNDGDGSMICINMSQLSGWLRTQVAAQKGRWGATKHDKFRSALKCRE
jgi:hypothetical protein